ncbi:unnamed protein product [Brachionus calyciflorus]|uniref:Uncharacterized protein n=1 Tax=Brachionus calyciflorus TaxID=104777 RepID=A0A814J7Z3_9BILA|nr:unnamed protein product [Brachionus calyciflorus]
MFSNSTTASLRSLNEMNARPKRTSYGEMSTWFFMDNNSEKLDQEYDKSFMDVIKNYLVFFNEFLTIY